VDSYQKLHRLYRNENKTENLTNLIAETNPQDRQVEFESCFSEKVGRLRCTYTRTTADYYTSETYLISIIIDKLIFKAVAGIFHIHALNVFDPCAVR
jgi:hypothetical protein